MGINHQNEHDLQGGVLNLLGCPFELRTRDNQVLHYDDAQNDVRIVTIDVAPPHDIVTVAQYQAYSHDLKSLAFEGRFEEIGRLNGLIKLVRPTSAYLPQNNRPVYEPEREYWRWAVRNGAARLINMPGLQAMNKRPSRHAYNIDSPFAELRRTVHDVDASAIYAIVSPVVARVAHYVYGMSPEYMLVPARSYSELRILGRSEFTALIPARFLILED